jgi:hypothetical protein
MEDFQRRQRMAKSSAPLVPGTEDLTPEAQDKAQSLLGAAIMARPVATWSQQDRDFIQGSVNAALKDLGY